MGDGAKRTRTVMRPQVYNRVEVYNRSVFLLVVFLAQVTWRTNWAQALESAKKEHKALLVDWDERADFSREPARFDQLTDVIFLQLGPNESNFVQASAGQPHPAGASSYILYGPDGQERFRVAKGALTKETIEKIRFLVPATLKAADLVDTKHELEASFLMGNTYNRLRMGPQARSAYSDAAKLATKGGDMASAQLAEAQSAFTLTYDGDPSRAIGMLKELTTKAADHSIEAIIWLMLGKANEAVHDTKSALHAYSHAQSLAAPGSRTSEEASKAIARLR